MFINSIVVEHPSFSIDEALSLPNNVDTLMNTKISNINMMTHLNYEKIKYEIKKDQLIRVPYGHPNYNNCGTQELTNQHTWLPN
jgi:hypothetical protein